MSHNCKDCLYWINEGRYHFSSEYVYNMGECNRMGCGDREFFTPNIINSKAIGVPKDGCEPVYVITVPEFGCVMWKNK